MKGTEPSGLIHQHIIHQQENTTKYFGVCSALCFTVMNKFSIFDWIAIEIYTIYLLHPFFHKSSAKRFLISAF